MRRTEGYDETHIGADYAPEELQFLRAMDRYKRAKRRPFPSWIEALGVLRELGWRPPTPEPEGECER